MTSLYLFRHAQSVMNESFGHIVGGRSNHIPLTPLGEMQAGRLGLWIRANCPPPNAIYVSPAVRTVETARIALSAAGIETPYEIEDRLQELSQGVNEGKERDEIYTPETKAIIKIEQKDFKFENGDSMNDVYSRADGWAEEVIRRPEQEIIYGFTHGFTVRCYVGGKEDWSHAKIRYNELDNAAATIMNFDDEGRYLGADFNINTQI